MGKGRAREEQGAMGKGREVRGKVKANDRARIVHNEMARGQ